MLRIHGNKFKHLAGLSYAGIAGSSAAFLLILASMLFASAASQPEASATENNSSTSTTTSTTENSSGISTYAVTPTVGISLPAAIDFDDVLPTPSGATTTATADLTVTTTNSASYSLYLYSSEGDNSLKSSNPANISKIIATAGDVGLTLSSLKPNTWGYNLGTTAPTDSTTYSAVPTNNSTPIQTKDTSDTNSANDTYTLSFGAKVDTTIASGAYSNTLTFAVVAEPAMVTVAFNGNGATSGSMSSIKIPAGDSQALPSNTFAWSGYDFTGWNTAANGGGTSYSDGATLTTTTAQAGQTITLYAQWKSQATYIQDFTLADCQAQASSGNVTVVDRRDDNEYTVRYINGACWMTQNLRLSGGRTLTSADSNVTQNWSFPATPLDGSNPSYTAPQTTISSNTSYGGYYNYCAASAGTVCSQSTMNATQDICPKGWRLPTRSEMNGITSYVSTFSPVYSGYYSSSLFYAGSEGYWWSATTYNSVSQYYLYYYRSRLDTDTRSKRSGFSVRCIRSS